METQLRRAILTSLDLSNGNLLRLLPPEKTQKSQVRKDVSVPSLMSVGFTVLDSTDSLQMYGRMDVV